MGVIMIEVGQVAGLIPVWFFLPPVSLLISRPLGVQTSCRYLSGRWERSPLIPTRQIRTIHLLDRVTNVSVRPQLCLELLRDGKKCQVAPTKKSSNAEVDAALRLEPLILQCLPLSCLVTIYRLSQAVLFGESVPSAF